MYYGWSCIAILTNEQYMKLINPFCGQSLFEYQGVPRKEAKTGFKDPEKVSRSPE